MFNPFKPKPLGQTFPISRPYKLLHIYIYINVKEIYNYIYIFIYMYLQPYNHMQTKMQKYLKLGKIYDLSNLKS